MYVPSSHRAASSAFGFLLRDYPIHFMYGTVLVLYSLVENTYDTKIRLLKVLLDLQV